MKNIISEISMKKLGQTIYRSLQKSFSEARDKRFKLEDKRHLTFVSNNRSVNQLLQL